MRILWGSTAHPTPCLLIAFVWLCLAMWGTAHRLGHHSVCVCVCVIHSALVQCEGLRRSPHVLGCGRQDLVVLGGKRAGDGGFSSTKIYIFIYKGDYIKPQHNTQA